MGACNHTARQAPRQKLVLYIWISATMTPNMLSMVFRTCFLRGLQKHLELWAAKMFRCLKWSLLSHSDASLDGWKAQKISVVETWLTRNPSETGRRAFKLYSGNEAGVFLEVLWGWTKRLWLIVWVVEIQESTALSLGMVITYYSFTSVAWIKAMSGVERNIKTCNLERKRGLER